MKEEILKKIDEEIELLSETRKCHSSPPTRYYLGKQVDAVKTLREKVSQMQLPVIVNLPTDEEVAEWFGINIDGDSASSAIYKFRLWLNERQISK